MTDRQIEPTEAHYAMLQRIGRGEVEDHVVSTGERPGVVDRRRLVHTTEIAPLVWDLEALGWAWRPAYISHWVLTREGEAAMLVGAADA